MNPVIKEWLFARELVRRIGFTPDEIFFACFPSGRTIRDDVITDHPHPVIGLELKRGDLTFRWMIGPVAMPADEIRRDYEAAVEAWNAGLVPSQEEFRASNAYRQAIPLMVALKDKGFVLAKAS